MRLTVVLSLVSLSLTCSSIWAEDAVKGDTFAVLIAASNSFWNYRHQADVAHAYHVLIDHGVKPENIITFAFDDIADDDDNPFPGKIYNEPNGVNFYEGFKIDYADGAVTPENVMAVLKGEKHKVFGGSGRVLKSTKNDKVFINIVDHGAPGFIAIIDDLLTAQQMNETLQTMHDKNLYGELVFYLEACESGSMFEDILPDDVRILAVTASNATESSWGTYCDDPLLDTCLGDLFSVNWMQDSDKEDLNKETLGSQFDIVKKKTDLSNVMKYGDLSITTEIVGLYQGTQRSSHQKLVRARHQAHRSTKDVKRWPARDIPLKTVESRLRKATDPVKKAELTKQLEMMKLMRAYHDEHTRALIQKILPNKSKAEHEAVLQRKPTKIADLACHHEVVTAYHQNCFNLGKNPYAMSVGGPLNNLCEQGIETQKIVDAIKSHCVNNAFAKQQIL